MENKYKSKTFPPLLFKELSENDLREYLSGVFKEIVTDTVTELDRSKCWDDYDISIKEFFLERKYVVV
jgi:hypothetical protein